MGVWAGKWVGAPAASSNSWRFLRSKRRERELCFSGRKVMAPLLHVCARERGGKSSALGLRVPLRPIPPPRFPISGGGRFMLWNVLGGDGLARWALGAQALGLPRQH